MKRFSKAAKNFCELVSQPSQKSYYPEKTQKSQTQIILDNLQWLITEKEINHFYYVYGLDTKDSILQNRFMGKRTFNLLRHQANQRAWFNGRSARYLCLLQDKFVFGQYLKTLGFNTPQNIALLDKNRITWLHDRTIESLEKLLDQDGLDVFIKEILGGCAEGVYPVKIQGGKFLLKDQPITIEDFRKKILGRCIVQQRIDQHPKMNELYSRSINTIRIVTALTNQTPTPLCGLFRAGVKNSAFDNWAAGGITVGIDMETGRLGKYGILRPEFGRKVDKHPDTGIRFENFEIPFFKDALEKTLHLHRFFYGVHSIGWDIAITENGPVFIEANNRWDMPMLQVHDNQLKEKFLKSLPK